MTVSEMLSKMDSHELSEWEAYENATGPLGFGYIHETLAELMDEVKMANLMASSKFEDGGPYPVPERGHIRAHEMYDWMKKVKAKREHDEEAGLSDEPDEVDFEEFNRQMDTRK